MIVPAKASWDSPVMGVVELVNKENEEGFTELDQRLIEELFTHVALMMLSVVQQWQAGSQAETRCTNCSHLGPRWRMYNAK